MSNTSKSSPVDAALLADFMQYNPTTTTVPQTGSASAFSGYVTSYPGYTHPVYTDKTQTAFTLAKRLMDKNLVEVATVKQFITLIDLIVGVL